MGCCNSEFTGSEAPRATPGTAVSFGTAGMAAALGEPAGLCTEAYIVLSESLWDWHPGHWLHLQEEEEDPVFKELSVSVGV